MPDAVAITSHGRGRRQFDNLGTHAPDQSPRTAMPIDSAEGQESRKLPPARSPGQANQSDSEVPSLPFLCLSLAVLASRDYYKFRACQVPSALLRLRLAAGVVSSQGTRYRGSLRRGKNRYHGGWYGKKQNFQPRNHMDFVLNRSR